VTVCVAMLFAYFSDGQQVGREWWTRRSLQLSHQTPAPTSLADRDVPPGPGTRPALCSHGKLMPHGYFSHVNALRELTTVKSEANDVCVNHFNLYVRKLGNTMLGL